MDYNVIVRVGCAAKDEGTTDRVLDALAGYSPAISWGADDAMQVTVTVQADGLAEATGRGVGAVEVATGADAVQVEALTTEEFDCRQ